MEVEFGDWQGFVDGTKALVEELRDRPNELGEKLQKLSDDVRTTYSFDKVTEMEELEVWKSQLIDKTIIHL